VIAVWTVVLAAAVGLAAGFGDRARDDYNAWQTFEPAGSDFLAKNFPDAAGANARVVVHASAGPLRNSDLAVLRDSLRAVPGVSAVSPPRMATTGDTALITVQYRVPVTEFRGGEGVAALQRAVAPFERADLRVELGGEVPENYTGDGGTLEQIVLLAAGVLLLVASGSLAAAGIALTLGAFGSGTGLALMWTLAGFTSVSPAAPFVVTALGLGCGIGYVLLFLARFRENQRCGCSARDAAAAANGSAGRAIVVAGTVVSVSLLTLLAGLVPQFSSFGLATAVVIVAVTLAAVTLLPALCALAGHRLRPGWPLKVGVPSRLVARRWVAHVAKRPLPWAISALVVLLLAAAPALELRTWPRDAGSLATSDTVRRAFDLTAAEFGPGANGPFTVAVDVKRVGPQRLARSIAEIRRNVGVARVSVPRYNAGRSTAVFTIEPLTGPGDEKTVVTLRAVRALLPSGMYLTGNTAYFAGVSDELAHRLWLLIVVVVAMAVVLLTIAFRAPVAAILTGALSLLSLTATYGVLVATIQWGWGAEVFGLPGAVSISSWAAVLMFIALFGLTTDYQVFISSRVREEWIATGNAGVAVSRGFASTAHVVVASGAIAGGMFGAFALDPDSIVKIMCLGVAVGLFVDVALVRMILLPAALTLLGRSTWWMPRRPPPLAGSVARAEALHR
jgi:putative drug exporter of the RND superfamily